MLEIADRHICNLAECSVTAEHHRNPACFRRFKSCLLSPLLRNRALSTACISCFTDTGFLPREELF